jgi:hypothetical protein
MSALQNIEQFKTEIAPLLVNYTLNYRFFEGNSFSDFGNLYEVEFESEQTMGTIDFWQEEWLGILVWDCKQEKELLNVLLSPEQLTEREQTFTKLLKLLL